MAQGSAVVDKTMGLAGGGTFDIQPAAGIEWVIHNIFFDGPCSLSWHDASGDLVFKTLTGNDVYPCQFQVTNTLWVRITNTDSASHDYGYSGVQTSP